jgi:hypothetical protein
MTANAIKTCEAEVLRRMAVDAGSDWQMLTLPPAFSEDVKSLEGVPEGARQ